MFTYKGSTSVITKTLPVIKISPKALGKMQSLVKWSNVEVGWLGVVERFNRTYTIKDIYLFEQEVNSVTCEITPESLALFAEDLLQYPNGMEIFNNIRMWGHSHVNMSIEPSHQDETQFEELAKNSSDYFIRIIANKRGELSVDLIDEEVGMTYLNLEWNIEDDCDSEDFYQEFLTKVKQKPTYNFKYPNNIVDLECESIESFDEMVKFFGLTNEKIQELTEIESPLAMKTYFENNILTPTEYISQEGYKNMFDLISNYLYGL